MSHDAFLAAIRADPADDLPRLVYADYLEERGDGDRAAFIRAQVDLALTDEVDPRRPALEDRAHELLAANERAWLGPLAEDLDEWEFARGFLDQVSVQSQRLSHPDTAAGLARHPVRRLTLGGSAFVARTDDEGPADRLVAAARDFLSAVEELDFAGWMWGSAEASRLLAPGVLTRLRGLDVARLVGWSNVREFLVAAAVTPDLTAFGMSGAAAGGDIAAARRLLDGLGAARLTDLALPDCRLSGEDLAELLAAPALAALTSLDVGDNLIADAAAAFRAAGPRLARLDVSGSGPGDPFSGRLLDAPAVRDTLTHLDASGREPDRRACEVLTGSGFWARAESLRLRSANVGPREFAPIAASAAPALRLLDLGRNRFGANSARLLAGAAWAGGLTWLGLANNSVTDEACDSLAGSGSLAGLRVLHLGRNPGVDDAGAATLARSPALARLRTLTVGDTAVTDFGADTLLNAPHWRLSGLGLSGLGLTPRTASAFASSPRLARLEWLDLSDNPALGGDALLPVAESPHLSPLCELDLRRVPVGERVAAALRQRLGRRLSQ